MYIMFHRKDRPCFGFLSGDFVIYWEADQYKREPIVRSRSFLGNAFRVISEEAYESLLHRKEGDPGAYSFLP